MSKLIKNITDFIQDEEGLTVVEYVVGAGLIVIALATVFDQLGGLLSDELNTIFDEAPAGGDAGGV
ncbi:Flp family type IVb pilin [Vibrio sinaloensis]|uniref:Flp family type IVb pilin n=1 Tax=Photobacterium sp. (strain ATCC 43367) TaxID=379097 RepID=UPI0020673988|nr:Flp family type IVb pilin [Vibrio sinaloensis]UPQ87493.1 Flp family type IVb pilin [Vibrio sinaloensis]